MVSWQRAQVHRAGAGPDHGAVAAVGIVSTSDRASMVVDGDCRRVGAVAERFQPRQQAVMPAKRLADAVPDSLANDTVGVVDVEGHRAHLALDPETDDGVAP